MKVARWTRDNDKIDEPNFDPIKAIAKLLAIASRQDYILNEKNEPIRHRHCYVSSPSDAAQKTFSWFKIENATPEKMKLSVNYRRNGTIQDILQLVRDVDYYNSHFNPGEAIPVETDFTHDIDELRMSPDYTAEPPDEDDNDDQPEDES